MSRIITIGREFGSGGRELGRRLAEQLQFEYYDKEIISEIAKHTSLSEQYVSQVLEGKPHTLYPIVVGHSFNTFNQHYYLQMQAVFKAQTDIINNMSEKSDCVIIGRCADYILREKNPYRIFVYADIESRLKRCRSRSPEDEHLTDKQLKKAILKVDRERAHFYRYYTGGKWGSRENYDLLINTTNTVIKEIVPVLAKMFK